MRKKTSFERKDGNETSLLFLCLPQIPVEEGNLLTVPTKLLYREEAGLLNLDFPPQKETGADRLQTFAVSSASDHSTPTDSVPAEMPLADSCPQLSGLSSSIPPCVFGRGKKVLRMKTADVRRSS